MFTFIVQILLLLFSAYVFTPFFGSLDLGILKFISNLLPLAYLGYLFLSIGLLVSLTRFLINSVFRNKFSSILQFSLFVFNLLIVIFYVL